MSFKLDEKGGAEILKHAAAAEISRLTKAVESGAGPGATSEVITTDRAHGVVRVPAYKQAKDGALTRGAAAAGLEVHPR